MKYSLVKKMTGSYILVIVICVALISVMSNILFEKQFKKYIINKQEKINGDLVNSIDQQYKGEKNWDVSSIETLGVSALENGIIIKVKDIYGTTIWDATLHNNGLCEQMLAHMGQNMIKKYPNLDGGYVENKYDLKNQDSIVGVLEIGYYGPFCLSDNDITFMNGINKIIIMAGLFSLVLSIVLGLIIAKRISNPISKVITKANLLSEGKFGNRINEKSNTKEISQLIETINNLACSLETQDMLRKRLTSDVAHELRTPLTSLQAYIEAMSDGVWEPKKERLESCLEEILRVNRLVSDLAKLSQYDNENMILDMTEFDLSKVIKNVIESFEKIYLDKKITVEFHEQDVTIFADKDKINQVIINILSNAIKYNKVGGNIIIKIFDGEDNVNISFKDNGIGISNDNLPYIFERFYRVDKSRTRSTGGSGIGLAITEAILEAHGGSIKANSIIGEGTEIIVTLIKRNKAS